MSSRTPELWASLLRALLVIALVASAALADTSAPQLSQRVTDLTGTLTTEQRARLESRSAALEKSKGAQLVVLVVPSTAPDTIESYALAVAEKNRIGREGTDDGVLLLVAKDDRKARVEVGYGLEGAIPDVTAHRIIGEYLAPHFRQNDFYGGLDEATQALAKLVEGEALPPPLEAPKNASSAVPAGIFAGFVVAFFLRALGRARGLRMVAGGALGAFAGWWATAALAGALAGAAAAALIGLLGIGGGLFAGGRGGFGGWGGGGFGGGGLGDGGGGGGWSGGGGSFGGGGASGSW